MAQNALGQSDYRIFKSAVSIEQNDEITLGYGTFFISKIFLFQKWINEFSWFTNYKYTNLGKPKVTLICWMGVVKNGHSLLGLGTLKSGVSQEWFDELRCFLHADNDAKNFN